MSQQDRPDADTGSSGQEHHNPVTEEDTASGGPAEPSTPDADDAQHETVTITDAPEKSRYILTVDGVEAGFAEYRRGEGQTMFTHTVVDPSFEGRGLGSKLARFVVEDAIARGDHIVPVCPFIRVWLHKHPEYSDHAEETPAFAPD